MILKKSKNEIFLNYKYIINSNNIDEISTFFNIPFSEATVDDIKITFEKGDMICQKY